MSLHYMVAQVAIETKKKYFSIQSYIGDKPRIDMEMSAKARGQASTLIERDDGVVLSPVCPFWTGLTPVLNAHLIVSEQIQYLFTLNAR